jgi:CBS-domain-containing membrane protein
MSTLKRLMRRIFQIIGVESFHVSHAERLASIGGAFAGILAIFAVSAWFLGRTGAVLVVASMGASAVLVFAVPHGALSQPWPVIAGHIVSALIGVSVAALVPNVYIAAPLAVGLAVGAMHYLRCIHPPGGATALAAVVGGAEIHELGYAFVVTPVAINVIVLVWVAIAFNYFFPWRRYPAYLMRHRSQAAAAAPAPADTADHIAHEDFVYALSEIDSLIDVTEDDLLKIYELVTRRRARAHFDTAALALGHYYSNGAYGDLWSVRQIVDWADDSHSLERKLIYKVVAGAGRRSSGIATVAEFARWAKYEVFRDEENWRRVVPGPTAVPVGRP